MTRLVAFLRGINLGKRTVKMEDLRKAFADMGIADARTLIASGNVLFEAEETPDLAQRIEAGLKSAFGFEVGTIIRSITTLKAMVQSEPFKGHIAGKDTKFYVFFLARPEADKLEHPCSVPGDFEVVGKTASDIFAVGWRAPNGRFGPGLDKLGKPFGTGITTRNWNTILRLIEKA